MHPEVQARVAQLTQPAPPLEEVAERSFIPVPGGRIRALHYKPERVECKRPVVMVPGFGVVPSGWHDWWAMLYDRAEVFYIETREKPTSLIERRGADLSMDALVLDMVRGLDHFEIAGRDYVIQGGSWGGTTLLAGLGLGAYSAPAVVAWNPVRRLWFNRWALKHLTPHVPMEAFESLRGLISGVALAGMNPVQRERLMVNINAADWRWKAAAEAQAAFDLNDLTSAILEEVLVFIGVDERVHSAESSEALARRIPRGRLFWPQANESENIAVAGLVALELARIRAGDRLPEPILAVERALN